MADESPNTPQLVDLALSQRLERAEGLANRRYIDAKRKAFPDCDAESTEVAGALAMFDTPTSPLTQTFGLGVFENPSEQDFERLEAFFESRGAAVFHEISPLADPAILATLHARGYFPMEVTSLLACPIADVGAAQLQNANPRLSVREVRSNEHDAYTKLAADAWGLPPEYAAFFETMAEVNRHNEHVVSFIAELDGKPIGSGGLCLSDDVALIAGDSTLAEARGQGAQLALIAARIEFARARGMRLLMMGAAPGSTSQKNGQRCGLKIAYTRFKWMKG